MIAHVGGVHQDPTTGAGGSGGSHQLSGAALRRAGRKVNDSRTSCSGACYARQGATRQPLASLSDTDAFITNDQFGGLKGGNGSSEHHGIVSHKNGFSRGGRGVHQHERAPNFPASGCCSQGERRRGGLLAWRVPGTEGSRGGMMQSGEGGGSVVRNPGRPPAPTSWPIAALRRTRQEEEQMSRRPSILPTSPTLVI